MLISSIPRVTFKVIQNRVPSELSSLATSPHRYLER